MANDIIQQVLGQYQAYVDFAEDGRWAYRFLVVAHQRSGLFIETQPGIYAFSHQNFREYLAATALIDRRDADMLALVQRHAADPSTNWVGCPPDLDTWVHCPATADNGADLLVPQYPITCGTLTDRRRVGTAGRRRCRQKPFCWDPPGGPATQYKDAILARANVAEA